MFAEPSYLFDAEQARLDVVVVAEVLAAAQQEARGLSATVRGAGEQEVQPVPRLVEADLLTRSRVRPERLLRRRLGRGDLHLDPHEAQEEAEDRKSVV